MWGYGPYGGMMGGYDGYGMGWGMLFGGIIWIVLLALGVAVVVWIVRSASGHSGGHPLAGPSRSSALDLLDERYARGEIDHDEYLQRKRHLLGRGAGG